ncbi:MAG: serpin family protein [Sporichthyaceae bacterium]
MGHRKTIRRAALAGAVAALVAACGGTGGSAGMAGDAASLEFVAFAGQRLAPAKDAPVDQAVAGMRAFAADLYRIAANPRENLVFSPLSVEYAFAMLRAGAAGNTAGQLDATFGFPPEIAAAVNALTNRLVTDTAPPPTPVVADRPEARDFPAPEPPVLAVSNALFTQRGYAYAQDFLRTLREQYDAGLQTVEFADEQAALAAVNGWVRDKTAGRIDKALDRVDPLTRLALANAVYLKASWPFPFEEAGERDFAVDGATVSVPAIAKEASLGYSSGKGWRSLTLPYFGDRLAMRIVLPTGSTTPADLMTPATLAAAARTTPTTVVLTMPTWNFGADLDLVKLLPELGLTDVFDEATANLSGITASERLVVDQAVHRATIAVDQLGTEAAAVTVVTARAVSAPVQPPMQFAVDRPFLFEIVDTETGAPLFVGQVVDPRA